MMKLNLKIYQRPESTDKSDSYWFQGLIAESKNFELIANGDIRYRGSKKLENDEDVKKALDNGEFSLSNWFEVFSKEDPDDFDSDSCCGSWFDALLMLIDRQEERNEQLKFRLLKETCPKCTGELRASSSDGYYAQCFRCDEDFYKVELAAIDNACYFCGRLYLTGDVDLLKDNTKICHNCKHKKNLKLTNDGELVENN